MKSSTTTTRSAKWLTFVKKNWFNLAVVAFLLFIFLKKDLSFQVQLNAPAKVNQPVTPKEKDQVTPQVNNSKKAYTEKQPKKASLFDKFEFPFIGRASKKVDPTYEFNKVDETTKLAYLKRFAHVAVSEQKKFGIPASITLASGLLHSFAGQRAITKSGNNHFGIKCTTDWEGEMIDRQGNCYRKYANAWTSFRDHSQYLTSDQFKALRSLDPLDYKAWAKVLEKEDFSNFDQLSYHLISIVNEYQLHELDRQ